MSESLYVLYCSHMLGWIGCFAQLISYSQLLLMVDKIWIELWWIGHELPSILPPMFSAINRLSQKSAVYSNPNLKV